MIKQETITINEDEMREAIIYWYKANGGSMEGTITLQLNCSKSSHGQGWAEIPIRYYATITRVLPETNK